MTIDPIELVRRELEQLPAPTTQQVVEQRSRMDAGIRNGDMTSPLRRRPRRWLPASGIAIAAIAVVVSVAFAVLPSADDDRREHTPHGALRLVTAPAGGAFRGLDLDTASAAEVLHAAGQAAADSVPDTGPNDWSYVRLESGGGDFPTTTLDRWTSSDGERSFAVSTVNITNPDLGPVGRHYSVHYEHLRDEVLGDVNWQQQRDGSYQRRASWSDTANDGSGEIARMVKLTAFLRKAQDADEVGRALEESIAGAKLEFRDGLACGTDPKFSSCGGSGFVPQAKGLTAEESQRLYLTGQLLTTMVSTVYPKRATKAIYDYLASLPEASVAPANDDSGDVILSLRVKGPSFSTHRIENNGPGLGYETRVIPGTRYNSKAVAVIDPDTGRLEQLNPNPTMGDSSTRYVAFGIALGPAVGGSICGDFPDACEEARDLEDRLKTNPKAKFKGVVDWMFIAQYCDGLINRDGSTRENAGLPRSMSNDPKVKAERAACEKREAAKAQAD